MIPADTLDAEEVAALLGIAQESIRSARARGAGKWATFPAPWRLVSGRPLWLRADIERWAARP